jgi:hypothetical protein
MSMNRPRILCITSDLPNEGAGLSLAKARRGKVVQDHGIEVVLARSCEDGVAIARSRRNIWTNAPKRASGARSMG